MQTCVLYATEYATFLCFSFDLPNIYFNCQTLRLLRISRGAHKTNFAAIWNHNQLIAGQI